MQDHPNWMLAASLPVTFEDIEVEWPGDPDTAPDLPVRHEDLPAFTDEGADDRAFVTVGQRVTVRTPSSNDGRDQREEAEETSTLDVPGDEPGGPVDTSFGSSGGAVSGPARGVRETLAHGGLGLGVGGALTFFGALVASSQLIAGLLLAGSVLAIGYALRVASSVGPNRHAAKRYVGTAAGLAIAAALVGGIGPSPSLDLGLRTLGPALFAVGFVTHAVLAEYDRRRLAAWASAPR